jgi:hypothetical protein
VTHSNVLCAHKYCKNKVSGHCLKELDIFQSALNEKCGKKMPQSMALINHFVRIPLAGEFSDFSLTKAFLAIFMSWREIFCASFFIDWKNDAFEFHVWLPIRRIPILSGQRK